MITGIPEHVYDRGVRIITAPAVLRRGHTLHRKILWVIPSLGPKVTFPDHRGRAPGMTVYTDASFKREETVLSLLTGDKPEIEVKASAGIYRGKDIPSIRVNLDGLPVLHSFAAEAVALVVALAAGEPGDEYVTDSQSIVTTINKRSHFTTRTNSPLLEILKWHANRIRWHQAHVERREPNRARWTPDEYGNFLADVVASDQPELGMVILPRTWKQMGDAIRELIGVYITDEDGLPLIEDPSNYYLR